MSWKWKYNERLHLQVFSLLVGLFYIVFNCNVVSAKGVNYFISNSGVDSNPGTLAFPWQSLTKANAVVQAGDTVNFLPGSYYGVVQPAKNGAEKESIVYRSIVKHEAILHGGQEGKYIVNFNEKTNVVVDGFKMLPDSGIGFVYVLKSQNIRIENCLMHHSTGIYCPIEFDDCTHVGFYRNEVSRVVFRTNDSKIHGDACHFTNSSYCIIEGNAFREIGHSPLRIISVPPKESANYIIRLNRFHNGWGRNFELLNVRNCLFESNLIADGFNGSKSADSFGKVFITNGIFRNTVVVQNWHGALASKSYNAGFNGGSVPLELKNTRIYHNIFANNTSTVWVFGNHSKFKNTHENIVFDRNLFYRNNSMGNFSPLAIAQELFPGKIRFLRNCFVGEAEQLPQITVGNYGVEVGQLNIESDINDSGNYIGNYIEIPQSHDFIKNLLNSYSFMQNPALAHTTSSGRGTKINVSDPSYFFDGYGIEGEAGDRILIGDQQVKVINVDLEGKSLIVDRQIEWIENEQVSLVFNSDELLVRMPYSQLNIDYSLAHKFSVDTLIYSNFEEKQFECWGYLWDRGAANIDSAYYPEKRTDGAGQCLCVNLAGGTPAFSVNLKMRNWDLDVFPFMSFSYRILPGTSVGVWLVPWEGSKFNVNICLADTRSHFSPGHPSTCLSQLIDDGHWHNAWIDIRKLRSFVSGFNFPYAIEFGTNKNNSPGQKFWIDDFVISSFQQKGQGGLSNNKK